MMDFEVKEITYEETKPFILDLHYAGRMPIVNHSFGLFKNNLLVGVCTIGKPPSNYLCVSVCGEEYAHLVFELNRLVVLEGLPKNILSFFVGKVLRLVAKHNYILVSYADEGMNHYGYIYQATNWIYTGRTRIKWDGVSEEGNIHPRHSLNRVATIRKMRTPKHRYVYFTGKSKKLKDKLNFPIKPYPKGESKRYILGQRKKETYRYE